ncbi:ankyrin repeat and SOCS box protein 17-like [Centruroides sculpturatus]|uniref:ankyrin repeat and SOCS box protein 17-like n=1 Tax=Centruroides sculpturatus TaxID=218467 RepID=UPI000C6E449D|nr:ankyrin repeat and SOCS box protein 17-like [Centruroides sculpturatus]
MGQHNCKRCKKSLVSKIFFRRDHFIHQEIISVLSFEQDDGQHHVTILNLHDRWKKLKHGKHCSEVLERHSRIYQRRPWLPPWISAVLKSKPTLLQLLLQHGSILESDNDLPVDICKYYWNPSHYFRNTISILWSNNINSLPTEYIRNDLQLQSSILIVKLLLRIIPQLQRRDMKLPDMTEIRSFVDDLSERGIIWNLRRRYLQPSELRHLCRCVIRRHLRKMWKLPLGIFELPLPNLLQKYLNLEDD